MTRHVTWWWCASVLARLEPPGKLEHLRASQSRIPVCERMTNGGNGFTGEVIEFRGIHCGEDGRVTNRVFSKIHPRHTFSFTCCRGQLSEGALLAAKCGSEVSRCVRKPERQRVFRGRDNSLTSRQPFVSLWCTNRQDAGSVADLICPLGLSRKQCGL